MKLTKSQLLAIGVSVAAGIVTLSDNLASIQAIVHIPHVVVQVVQVGAILVNLFCRSVLPANSGVAPLGIDQTGKG